MVQPSLSHRTNSTWSSRDYIMMLRGSALTLILVALTKIVMNESSASADLFSSLLTMDASSPEVVNDGWNKLHIHYGAQNHLLDPIPDDRHIVGSDRHAAGSQWFSQHNQDLTIARLFDFTPNLFFIDLAANDAVWASNTFALERNLGWKGLCIEPNPYYWFRLAFRTQCTAIGAIGGSSSSTGEEVQFTMELNKAVGPTGGIVGPEFGNKLTSKFEPRYTVSFLTLLQRFNAPQVINYLSLDVEGAEGYILIPFFEGSNNDAYTIQSMSIERPSDELIGVLQKHGYQKVLDFARGDTLWVHESYVEQAKANLDKHPNKIEHAKEVIMAKRHG